MTPKEKAKELVKKYLNIKFCLLTDNQAKQCVLIFIDEMIREIKEIQFNEDIFMEDTVISYWSEVKQEINKL